MSFIRPEITRWVARRGEAIAWAALLALGVWSVALGLRPFAPVLLIAGGIAALAGAALLTSAVRRMAFGADGPEEGLVEIDEGRITYFGPRGGGVVDINSVIRVELATRPHLLSGTGHAWMLTADDGTRLTIPLGAQGADRLPDALSPLPGLDLGAGAAALASSRPGRVLVWARRAS